MRGRRRNQRVRKNRRGRARGPTALTVSGERGKTLSCSCEKPMVGGVQVPDIQTSTLFSAPHNPRSTAATLHSLPPSNRMRAAAKIIRLRQAGGKRAAERLNVLWVLAKPFIPGSSITPSLAKNYRYYLGDVLRAPRSSTECTERRAR